MFLAHHITKKTNNSGTKQSTFITITNASFHLQVPLTPQRANSLHIGNEMRDLAIFFSFANFCLS